MTLVTSFLILLLHAGAPVLEMKNLERNPQHDPFHMRNKPSFSWIDAILTVILTLNMI